MRSALKSLRIFEGPITVNTMSKRKEAWTTGSGLTYEVEMCLIARKTKAVGSDIPNAPATAKAAGPVRGEQRSRACAARHGRKP